MTRVTRSLILASTSPRRRELLREAGYAFEVIDPGIDEGGPPGEPAEERAERLALAKAHAVAIHSPAPHCVLAADTLVVIDGDILEKPADAEEAQRMLLRLAGNTHRVLTGYALVTHDDTYAEAGVQESWVRMRAIEPEEARAYAASGEPLDKAGAYAAQGEGARFILEIQGSLANVIGLPLEHLAPRLARLGIHPD